MNLRSGFIVSAGAFVLLTPYDLIAYASFGIYSAAFWYLRSFKAKTGTSRRSAQSISVRSPQMISIPVIAALVYRSSPLLIAPALAAALSYYGLRFGALSSAVAVMWGFCVIVLSGAQVLGHVGLSATCGVLAAFCIDLIWNHNLKRTRSYP